MVPRPYGIYPQSDWAANPRAGAPYVRQTFCLILIEVFGRHIVLFNLFGVNFRHVCVRRILHTADRFGLEGLALFDKLFDALRARLRDVRQPLIVPRLAGRIRPYPLIAGQNGIVWAAENVNPAVLHAYNAKTLVEIYNTNQAANGRDQFGNGNKYITPTIANGKVYVGTTNGVGVLGLLNAK